MSDSPTPTDPYALLGLALEKAGIPPKGKYKPSLMSRCYWQEVGDDDIEIVFSTWHYGAGQLTCSIRVYELAKSVINVIPEHDVLNALTDACLYLKEVVFTLLPVTQNNILARAHSLAVKRFRPRDQAAKKSLNALFEILTYAYSDSRAGSERRLRGESKNRRGGSDPRLPKDQRESLHAQYEVQYKRAKTLKKEHDAQFKKFTKSHRRTGYSNDQWLEYWMKSQNADEFPEEIQRYLAMFASLDRPSASDIAYQVLAAKTSHKRSYLERLVARSRKASKRQQ